MRCIARLPQSGALVTCNNMKQYVRLFCRRMYITFHHWSGESAKARFLPFWPLFETPHFVTSSALLQQRIANRRQNITSNGHQQVPCRRAQWSNVELSYCASFQSADQIYPRDFDLVPINEVVCKLLAERIGPLLPQTNSRVVLRADCTD